MPNQVRALRSSTSQNRPTGRLPGELYVNFADNQFGVINPSNAATDLIAVRYFSATASYFIGDYVIYQGIMYRALAPSNPGAFIPANWSVIGGSVTISDIAPSAPQAGQLWFDSVGGQLYVWYNDGNTSQWVIAVNQGTPDLSGFLLLTGGTMTGPLTLATNPVTPLQSAPKQYVDAGIATVNTTIAALVPAMNDNRIINGDMWLDQRGVASGAGGTVTSYTVDRWQYGGNTTVSPVGTWTRVNSTTMAANGFPSVLTFTSSTAHTSVATDAISFFQCIEADMISDFAFGTAGAQPVTLSFWVNVSIAGTYSGALCNYLGTRSYSFLFAIPVGWTKVVVTIPGDTTGTWTMLGNGGSLYVCFDLGCGANYRGPAGAWSNGNWNGANGAASVAATNGAIFQLTGVKLEIGTVATPYNRQSVTKRIADCQRYFWTIPGGAGLYYLGLTTNNTAWSAQPTVLFPVAMRSSPTMLNAAFTVPSGSPGTPAYGAVTPQYATINNPSNSWTQGPFNATVGLSAQFSAEL
jgi:hypothetical protein